MVNKDRGHPPYNLSFKGHGDAEDHGKCTLSMKNNYGTCFTANNHQGFAYTVAIHCRGVLQ